MSLVNVILFLILALIFVLPLVVKPIEENLEIFLFVMGILAAIAGKALNVGLAAEIFSDVYLYVIVAIVLGGGFLFRVLSEKMSGGRVHSALKNAPAALSAFLLTVVLGLLSSVITAIVASLFLVEIVNLLPLSRAGKIRVNIAACFSIGLGAVLTPVGEPLATIVIGRLAKDPALHADFFYMIRTLGIYVLPGIFAFGLLAAYFAKKDGAAAAEEEEKIALESYPAIVFRALKIFLFLIALNLLGSGFKPIIDAYVMHIPSMGLYWINMCSAILDNATLASAEISASMQQGQIVAILMGLLVSGGMMIPGNIPNIISAGKLKIKSREWIRLGVPLGLIAMAVYFAVIFFF
jgi:predicted cation transporter